MNAWQTLQYYFTFPFVRYALVVGVLPCAPPCSG